MSRAVGDVIRGMKQARADFRIAEFSLQDTHIHLLVEADDERALSSAMRSFKARVSRRLNDHVLQRRRGPVWSGRYHRVDLTTPRQVRHALVYVLQNGVKHGVVARGEKDAFSSARWSDCFITRAELPPETSLTSTPRTALLGWLWQRCFPGFISPTEAPRAG